jgi:molybdenum cofactor biosynthesis enzyme
MANNNNNNNYNSIKFNILTCRLKSISVYYNASTNTQIKHNNSANIQKQNTKQTKQKQYGRKSSVKSTRAKAINPPKNTDKLIFLCHRLLQNLF